MNYSRMLTVMRTDLKQLAQSKDFWVPMTLLGGLFFLVIPTCAILTLEAVRVRRPQWRIGDERSASA